MVEGSIFEFEVQRPSHLISLSQLFTHIRKIFISEIDLVFDDMDVENHYSYLSCFTQLQQFISLSTCLAYQYQYIFKYMSDLNLNRIVLYYSYCDDNLMKMISNYCNLRELCLESSDVVKKLNYISGLNNLRILSFYGSRVFGDLHYLSLLTNLTDINFSTCKFSEKSSAKAIDFLEKLTNICKLKFGTM